MEIRPLRPDEWPLHRELRLRALAAAPDAFGATLEEQQARSDADWEQTVRGWLATGRRVPFVAFDEQGALGMAVASYDDNDPSQAMLTAMWVEPRARGSGVAAPLVEQVVAWARERSLRQVILHVTEGNETAARLYERAGFAFTGTSERLRPGSPLHSREMALELE